MTTKQCKYCSAVIFYTVVSWSVIWHTALQTQVRNHIFLSAFSQLTVAKHIYVLNDFSNELTERLWSRKCSMTVLDQDNVNVFEMNGPQWLRRKKD